MAEPKFFKQLRGFVGTISYHKSLWPKRSLKVAPLTAMTGKDTVFKWMKVHREVFHDVKDMVARDTMISHPHYKLLFVVHTDLPFR